MPQPLFDGLPSTALVTTEWLADRLGAERLVVLDASVVAVPGYKGGRAFVSGEQQYRAAHLPGAVFADLLEGFSDPEGEYAFTRPSTRHFERAAEAHGIDNDTAVVVYDSARGTWAARLWWLFRSFGFEVRVLDGGLAKWRAERRPIETGEVRPRRAGDFSAHPDEQAWAEKSEIESIVAGRADAVLVCALPHADFTGEAGSRPRRGHIPGSLSAPASLLIDRDTNTYLPPERLHDALGPAATATVPVVTYCGAGIAAASDALALALLGRGDVRLYDGSLNEWAADASAPLETGESAAAAALAHR